jgi:hypothetical protein
MKESKPNPLTWVAERKEFLNIIAIERYCKIRKGTLANALLRNQSRFTDSGKLEMFLNLKFPRWDNGQTYSCITGAFHPITYDQLSELALDMGYKLTKIGDGYDD